MMSPSAAAGACGQWSSLHADPWLCDGSWMLLCRPVAGQSVVLSRRQVAAEAGVEATMGHWKA